MRIASRVLGGALVSLGALAWVAPVLSQSKVVLVAPIRGTIDPGSSNFLKSSIVRARKQRAAALIVELDTPGGLVSSVQEMAQSIAMSTVPVVVYVTPAGATATSAGALLSLASHISAMAPGTHIGAAHPVDSSGKEVEGAMGEKVLNDTVAFAKSLAEVRGRSIEIAEAVVRKSQSLTAQEALKKNFIELIAPTRTDLIQALDGRQVKLGGVGGTGETVQLATRGAEVVELEMTLGQKILHLLANPNIATILMTVGMLLIYVEVSNPGITIAGALGIVCVLIALISFQLLPIRTGGLVLLILGAGLVIAEPFVPTSGALAFAGTLAFVLGLIWILDPAGSDLRISPAIWIPSALAFGGGALLIGWGAARSLRLVRQTRERIGGEGKAGLEGYEARIESVDPSGKTGMALIRGELWMFDSNEPFQAGEKADVEQVHGMRVSLRKKKG